ncbi:hypothetical protein [Peptoniphilus asaccharolyticus]
MLKKLLSVTMSCSILVGSLFFPINVYAESDIYKNTTGIESVNKIVEHFSVENNGENLDVIITENKEIFINGKNITTVESKVGFRSNNFILFSNDDWKLAGTHTYRYDLSGLTISAASKIITKAGLKISLEFLKSETAQFIQNGVLKIGVYIEDERTTYYKDTDHWGRPLTRSDHTIYLAVYAFGNEYYRKLLMRY